MADPPYFEIKGEFDFGVFKDKNEYLAWCKKWLMQMQRILKDNGTLIL
ncbi:DNA methyltransferase [Campylobacter sp. LR185c]